MTERKNTKPHERPVWPIRTLAVEVDEGPDRGRSVVASGESLSIGTARDNDLVLSDPTVSRYHLELERRRDGIRVTDQGSTNGTLVGTARLERGVVAPGAVLTLGQTKVRVSEGHKLEVELFERDSCAGLLGRTPVMRRLFTHVSRTSLVTTPVLIVGESGSGKELVARALHDLGPRAAGPFVTVNCGALAPSLVASELFGHEAGAFVGATTSYVGAFERAHGGTLFLDEIGELPAGLQTVLQAALERRELRRVGGSVDIPINLRLITATHHDLRADINAGSFRLDLYYRIAAAVLRLAPLRERSADIPLLVEHFLAELGQDPAAAAIFSPAVIESLCQHSWPGNVRELRNLVEASVAFGEALPVRSLLAVSMGTPATPGEATPGAQDDSRAAAFRLSYRAARAAVLADFEPRFLRELLARAGNNVSLAARLAEMDRSHLIDLLRRHGLRR